MTWRSSLQNKTRQPAFLWRLVIWILAAGVAVGFVVQRRWPPSIVDPLIILQSSAAWKQLDTLAETGAWSQLWWALPKVVFRRFDAVGPVVLSTIVGVCWFAFLWQALRTPGVRNLRLWYALAAMALGALSIWPTHFFALWQEHVWNLHDDPELIPGIRFYVLGVGLREEAAKLLCLLPLVPLLLHMRDELTALLVSGCVGLGFAVAENVNYFVASGGQAAMTRFLTANPLHITLTGLAGLAVYRALRDPRGWGSHSLGTLGLVVFAHGLYDAFIGVPALLEYSFFSMIIFAGVVYQFFHELRELRPTRGDVISLSATFLCGVSVVTAATFVYLSGALGMAVAFDALAGGVISLGVMVYLFLREMPETMVSV